MGFEGLHRGASLEISELQIPKVQEFEAWDC